jgi:hypothetical protein
MVVRSNRKMFVYAVFFLLMATGALVACGGSSSTTASSSSSSSSTSGSSGSGASGTGNRPNRVTGTITQYNASAKTLTIIETDSAKATFSISNARILKNQKITQQQLSSLLGNSGTIVQVMGQQTSTGTYTAQTIVVSDRANSTGGAGPAGTRPNGTPPAGAQGAMPNGTPPAGAPQGQGGQNGSRVVVQNGKLQNNQLVGTDRAGKAITVNLSGTTTIIQQTVATAGDLQTGQTVTILGAPAQSGGAAEARQILIGNNSMM